MGFMDLFSNMSEWDLQDLQQGGIIGAAMKAKVRKETEGARTRVKPGKYCREVCTIDDDRCAPCLEIQQRLKKSIGRITGAGRIHGADRRTDTAENGGSEKNYKLYPVRCTY